MADAGKSFMNVAASTASGAAMGSSLGPYGAIAGAGIGMISGMVTEFLAAGKEDEAAKVMEAAYEQLDGLEIAKLEQVLAQTVPESELKKIKTDPKLKAAQFRALEKIQEVAEDPDLTLADQARVNQVLAKTNRAAQANNSRVLEAMAGRGQLNSGAALAAQLQNNQASAEQANEQGMDIAGRAQERALQAMMQGGELAGRMRGQDFSEQAQIGAAQDAINKYNAGAKERAVNFNNENAKWSYSEKVKREMERIGRAKEQAGQAQAGAQGIRDTGGQILSAGGQIAGQFAGGSGNNNGGSPPPQQLAPSAAAQANYQLPPLSFGQAPAQPSANFSFGLDEDINPYTGGW